MYVVLKVYKIYFVGDWSNGMIGVSKTFTLNLLVKPSTY